MMKQLSSYNINPNFNYFSLFHRLPLLSSTSSSNSTSISTSFSKEQGNIIRLHSEFLVESLGFSNRLSCFNRKFLGNFNFLLQRLRLLSSTSNSSSISNEKGNNNNNNNAGSYAQYLVESLSFSKQQSLTTSAKLIKWRHNISIIDSKFVDNADSVIQFFKQLGFQTSHIRQLISCFPKYLCSGVDKSLKPKVELLSQVGISGSDLVHVVTINPRILTYQSLGSAIHALRDVLGTDDHVVSLLMRRNLVNFRGIADNIIPNVQLLQTCYGIPVDNVRAFVIRWPSMFAKRSDLFRDVVIKVKHEFGIPTDSPMFLYGIYLLCFFKAKLEDKFQVFKSFGWDQSDVMALIRKNPVCLSSSEGRIKERLGFLMNQLGYEPNYLASHIALFTCSLEKRLLPRHRVLQVLKEKGLCKKDYSLTTLIRLSESKFLERFVLPFEEVHQVYEQLTGCKVG